MIWDWILNNGLWQNKMNTRLRNGIISGLASLLALYLLVLWFGGTENFLRLIFDAGIHIGVISGISLLLGMALKKDRKLFPILLGAFSGIIIGGLFILYCMRQI
jgi:hypothetical protein